MTSIIKSISDILFIDIETSSIHSSYSALTEQEQYLWNIKARQLLRKEKVFNNEASELYAKKAAIYSEFAKIICISVGYFKTEKGRINEFRTKSFYEQDEKVLLENFKNLLHIHFDKPDKQAFGGHNIREFDLPFICRRMIINRVQIPKILDISGKKPWQVKHVYDTLELWRFGDYKNYSSLELLTSILNVPGPKDDIDGSQIHNIYWNENDMERIVNYCEKDVYCSALVYLKMNQIDFQVDLPHKSSIYQ